jgi:hypothetical protein
VRDYPEHRSYYYRPVERPPPTPYPSKGGEGREAASVASVGRETVGFPPSNNVGKHFTVPLEGWKIGIMRKLLPFIQPSNPISLEFRALQKNSKF